MHHVHSKVFPAVCEVHTRQDWELSERCRLLRGNLTPSLVGILGDYHCPYPSTLRHLNSLAHLDTPLEMLYAIQDAMVSHVNVTRKSHEPFGDNHKTCPQCYGVVGGSGLLLSTTCLHRANLLIFSKVARFLCKWLWNDKLIALNKHLLNTCGYFISTSLYRYIPV